MARSLFRAMGRWRRSTRLALALASIALCAIAAMAIDDVRFWARWFARVPAMAGLPESGSPNAIPDLRVRIASGPDRALIRRRPNAEVAAAIKQAERYLAPRRSEAFLVWHDGALIAETYWTGDAKTARPAGAMAKSLVAILAGRAIREGAVSSLDAPVADTLSEWRGDVRSAIRWRDLLSMHAGLQWYREDYSPFSDFQRIIIGSDYPPRALQLRAINSPGQVFDYSAWTYDIAGIALARAGGRPYERLVERWLSAPLGLGEMAIYADRPEGNVHANCCLFDRADDWIRLGALLVAETQQPSLLPEGFVQEMARGGADQSHYGMGVWLGDPFTPVRHIASPRNPYPTPIKSIIRQSEPYAARDVLIFEGVGQTKTWIIPSQRLVIVRFGKAPEDWDDAVVPNLLIESVARSGRGAR